VANMIFFKCTEIVCAYKTRLESFGLNAFVVDGHDVEAL